jgi:hypothetical protein
MDWHKLSKLAESELARFDIAHLNLIAAQGLPGAERLDIARCLRTLDEWTERVRGYTQRIAHQFHRNPGEWENCWERFLIAAMLTHLQRDIGLSYPPALREMDDRSFYKNAAHLFVHGVVDEPGGTCSSLPVVYTAIGRRLGYSLKLVLGNRHLFARWDAPGQPRFNVECTSRGFVSHPDEHYLNWPTPVPPEDVVSNGLLRSMTPREELVIFLGNRGAVWSANQAYGDAVEAYVHAYRLAPNLRYNLLQLQDATAFWGRQLRSRTPVGFPGITIAGARGLPPGLSRELAGEITYLAILEYWLNQSAANQHLWEPMRRDPSVRPPGLPDWIDATYSYHKGQATGPAFSFRTNLPKDCCFQITTG